MSDYNDCVRQKMIVFGNDFKDRKEINRLFGLDPNTGFMRGGWRLTDTGREAIIWCPNDPDDTVEWVNVKERFGDAADSRGYKEVLLISEKNRDDAENARHLNDVLSNPGSQMRYVFWHEERKGARWYKFYGQFKFMCDKSAQDGKCWFERISNTISL